MLAALCALLLAWCLVAGPMPKPCPSLFILFAGTVALELAAVPTGAFGFLSAGVACFVAMGLLPSVGVRAAALTVLIALVARTVARASGKEKPLLVRELLVDLTAALGALSLAALLAPSGDGFALPAGAPAAIAAVVAWTALASALPGPFVHDLPRNDLLDWMEAQASYRLLRATVATAGVAVAVLASASGWHVVWLLPLLWASQRVGGDAIYRVRAVDLEAQRHEMQRSAEAWDSARTQVDATRLQLQDVLEERRLTEGFSQHLAASHDPVEAMDFILDEAARLVPHRSAAIFLPAERGLVPARYRSPLQARLDDAGLLEMSEPIVEEAWYRKTAVKSNALHLRGPRLFEGEQAMAAVALQDQAVLYLGREEARAFTEEDLDRLTSVAGPGGLALQSTRHYQAQQEALQRYAEGHSLLDGWVRRLKVLLEGSHGMASSLEASALLDSLVRHVVATVPHDWGMLTILSAGPEAGLGRQWGGRAADSSLAVGDLVRVVHESMRPLLLEDVRESRFESPCSGMRSVLAIPMLTRQGCVGVLLLAATAVDAFDREHLDLLFVLACQAGAALSHARLYEEVVEAHQRLKESQAQLVQSSKMAAVGQLAAGVAHEINSPLGAILLALDLAESQVVKKPEAVLKRLARARNAANRARHIIEKLLLYARGSGPEQQELDPCSLVSDACEFLSHQFEMDGFILERDLPPVGSVKGSSNELQQVLVNLMLNARDAVERHSDAPRRLRVFTAREGEEACMGVQDWGEGIAPDILPRIFEPFFSIKPVGKGTGLGLSVSQQIVGQHGGCIQVTSEPGRGSTFIVRLPVASEWEGQAP